MKFWIDNFESSSSSFSDDHFSATLSTVKSSIFPHTNTSLQKRLVEQPAVRISYGSCRITYRTSHAPHHRSSSSCNNSGSRTHYLVTYPNSIHLTLIHPPSVPPLHHRAFDIQQPHIYTLRDSSWRIRSCVSTAFLSSRVTTSHCIRLPQLLTRPSTIPRRV